MSWLYPILPIAPDECPTSYVSRLARANFANSAREFCRDIGLSFQAIADGCAEAFGMLAKLTGIRTVELENSAIRSDGKSTTLRGEKLLRTSIRRTQVFVCPACLRADIGRSRLPPDQAAYGRVTWRLAAVHTCPAHGLALVEMARADRASVYDFSLLFRPRLGELDRLAASAIPRPASGLERYVVDRVDGVSGRPEWLDRLDLHAAVKTCEMLGVSALFSRKHNLTMLTPDEWRTAGGKGFEIARAGEVGIRAFLSEMHASYRESRVPNEGPHARFGKLYEWLAAVGDDPCYRPVRELVRRCIVETMPLGPPAKVFDEVVAKRLVHSIRTASLETGMNSMPLRRALEATGVIPVEQRHLQDHRVIFDAVKAQPILAKLTGAMSLKQAETYLNAGRVHTKLLLDHGFIKPLLGEAAKELKAILFDAEDLDRFMAKLLERTEPVADVPADMADIPKAAKRSNCRAMEIVSLILDGKIEKLARLAGTRGYMSVLVDVAEVRGHVRGPALDDLTNRKVMEELGTFHAVVRALMDEGDLPTRRAINPHNRAPLSVVSRADLDVFRRKYVSLAELARRRHAKPRRLRAELAKQGIEPALRRDTYHVDFYLRADIER